MATNNCANYGRYTFYAKPTASATNVTGDGTACLLVLNSAPVNDGSCFNTGTYTYVVPRSGNYYIHGNIKVSNATNLHTSGQYSIYINGIETYIPWLCNTYACSTAGAIVATINGTMIIPLVKDDALTFYLTVSGGAKTVGYSSVTRVSGFLIL